MEEETVTDIDASVTTDTFSEDIARYFKTFLETGLRGDTLQPARQLTNVRTHGLKTSVPLVGYPQLYKNMYKNITAGFAQETFVVSQNRYVTHNDDRVTEVFAQAIESVDDAQLRQLTQSAARALLATHLQYRDDIDGFTAAIHEHLKTLVATELIAPMFREVQFSSDHEIAANAVAIDATEHLFGVIETDVMQIAQTLLSGEQTFEALTTELRAVLATADTKRILRDYLEVLSDADAYHEIYRLHRSKAVLPAAEAYVYFAELTIGGTTFPLFYVPIRTTHAYPSVTIHFEDQIFVHTKAITYALDEYNRTMGRQTELPDMPRLVQLDNKNRKQCLGQLQTIIDQVAQCFHIEQPLKLDSASLQVSGTADVCITNNVHIALFDATHETIAREYDVLLAPRSAMRTALHDFTRRYVTETPVRYVQEVAEEWEAKTISEKLMPTNPLPLNDEQQQALLALQKPDCRVVTVDGAPGTGKTHLASGIVAQSYIDGFSTLVLSETTAALDDVEQKVHATLADVRTGTEFHLPVLRLDQIDETLLEDVEAQFIEKLRSYHHHFTQLQSELRTAKNRKIQDVADTLQTLTQNAENVNLHEVEQTVTNESKFGGRDWIQDEPIEKISPDLQRLHQAIQYIRGSDANYLLPYIESSQQKTIAAFLAIVRDYEKAHKSVNQRMPEFIVRYRKLLPEQKTKLQSALSYIHSNYRQYTKILADDPITTRMDLTDSSDYRTIAGKQVLLEKLIETAKQAKRYTSHDKQRNLQLIDELLSYDTEPEVVVEALTNYIDQVESLKSKIFGFSGRTLVVENLTRQLKKSIPTFSLSEPERRLDDLQMMIDLTSYTIEQLAQLGLELSNWKEVLYVVKTDTARVKELQKIIAALVVPADFEFMAGHRIYESDNLLANISLLQYATQLNDVFKANPNLSTLFGIKTIGQVLAQPHAFSGRFNKLGTDLDDVKQLDDNKKIIKLFIKTYPDAARRLGVNYAGGTLDIIDDTFAESSIDDVKDYLTFKKKEQDITSYFRDITTDLYGKTAHDLRQMTATHISYTVDAALVAYVEQKADEFMAVKQALRTRQRIPDNLFAGLQKAFPTILATPQAYATFLPLKKQLFDVVVIDDASRMTVAETLPALLRGKRIVVLGDDKQFTSLRSQDARRRYSELFKGKFVEALGTSLASVPADTKHVYLAKAELNFDVTSSVLSFCRPIAGSEITLTKQFRAPYELMSFANKTFYAASLKSLKARTVPLNEAIRFTILDDDSSVHEPGVHTNPAEAKHIIGALTDMKEAGYTGSIGIVTPHFEQATLIQRELDECVITDWFAERQLKVMTFDTAQGEARDYMFYSMVASSSHHESALFGDELSGVEPLSSGAKRLLVGFSRAQETMHIVLSKQPQKYRGALAAAFVHFQAVISNGVTKKTTNTGDILLAAESLVPQYFYATTFAKKHADKARLVTQFSLGEYLQPLMPRYRYPGYKVDFLVVFGDERIVITFDEFKENFLSTQNTNRDTYITADEIYAQKVLEGYGYKFLRLNKFNLGSKPIERLDALLNDAVKQRSWPHDNGFIPKNS